MVGCNKSTSCRGILFLFFTTHRFQILPFMASPSGCPYGLPLGRPSRTECYTEHYKIPFLRSEYLSCGALPAFRLRCPSGLFNDFRPWLYRSLTQPSKERLAFFLVNWMTKFPRLSKLWLFHRANPEVWMSRSTIHLRILSRLHHFKVTFYRWPDISKICHERPKMQIFPTFCINGVSTWVINNC